MPGLLAGLREKRVVNKRKQPVPVNVPMPVPEKAKRVLTIGKRYFSFSGTGTFTGKE
jgi:hypothetical protein